MLVEFVAGNAQAERFYAKVGFKEIGRKTSGRGDHVHITAVLES